MKRAAAEAAHMSAPDHGPNRSRRFLLLLKGRPHMSQTLTRAVGRAGSASNLHFVNLRETEAEREQPVLLAHRPGAGEAETLAQPHPLAELTHNAAGCDFDGHGFLIGHGLALRRPMLFHSFGNTELTLAQVEQFEPDFGVISRVSP